MDGMDGIRGPHGGAAGPRLAAVDDHAMILRGILSYVAESAPDVEWVGSAGSVAALPSAVTAPPSVVLLDIELNDGSDVTDNVGRLRAWGPRVMLFSREHRPVVVRRGIEAGALGLVLKEDPEVQLVEAVRAAHTGNAYVSGRLAHQIVNDPRGRVRLSPRQLEVAELLARGFRVEAIARRLYMTEETVRTHRRRAIEAFGRDRGIRPAGTSELVYRLMADGHVDLGPAGSDGPGTPPPGAAG
ncbi:response regulator transcription factor [Streptomyces somaliensis]|uniref:response regulator transcription factor n=1 Tax=Streptomyces somaliensis TaxID=78355 RepID=UPI0020CB8664|nr:response regulator transcription factor [Streptomyces somaliensis]MCP9946930.1 response regulator transcription factor [Streptomyces somaliensis]MCP9963564.1 response regulator transcription factor [Streptomyces somaliensis]MCP9976167.1 response regulator transcription factor [Streptomyces somaliensis]